MVADTSKRRAAESLNGRDDGRRDSGLRLLRKATAGTLLVTVGGAGLSILVHLFVARLIGQAEYGVYALMLSWIGVLAVAAQMGQDANVVRFLPTYIVQHEWGYVRGLRRAIGSWVFVAAVLIGCLGCVFVYLAGQPQPASWRVTFYVGFAMLPLMTQLQQSAAFLRALKHAVASAVYSNLVRKVVLIAALGVAVVAGVEPSAALAAAATAVAMLVAWVLSAQFLAGRWPSAGRRAQPAYAPRAWFLVGSKLGVMSIVIVAGRWLDVLILGALVNSAELGAYYAAVQIAVLAWYGASAANVILGPMLAERYDAADYEGMQAVARRAAWYAFSVAIACAVLFALLGRWALGLFGGGFEIAYVPMIILVCSYCVAGVLGDAPLILSMTRYQLPASLFSTAGVVANCAVAVTLIPKLGLIGAALGAVSSQCVWRLLSLWFVMSRLHINPSIIHGAVRAR